MHRRPIAGIRGGIAVAAVSMLVATACGSTVPRTQSGAPAAAAAGGGQGLGAPAAGSGAAAGKVKGGGKVSGGTSGGGSLSGGGTTGVGTTSGGTSGVTTTGGGSSGAQAARAPGITDTTIYIGTVYIKNQGAANAALGAGGLNQGDARKPYKVMIDMINSEGGVGGRKLAQV